MSLLHIKNVLWKILMILVIRILPTIKYCFEGEYVVTHTCRRRAEVSTKAFFDMRFYLRANTEVKLPLTEVLQVPGLVGQVHGIARARPGDAGCDIHLGGVL